MASTQISVDLTTAYQKQEHLPHGTLRVERKLIEALARLRRDDISFCRFDARSGRMVALSREEALAIATANPAGSVRRQRTFYTRTWPVIASLHKFEVWFRRNVRDAIRRQLRSHAAAAPETVAARAQPINGPAPVERAGLAPESILLLPGELQRQDFSYLIQVRRAQGMRMAIVFYDLLDTLAEHDPRANDPDATDIPGSEFIMREASLILPISDQSGNELRKHAAARGMALPPMRTIRLGHEIADVPPTPVDGLVPGQFVLSVGDLTGRKNHRLLTDIWTALVHERSLLPIPLVIVGRIAIDGTPLVAAVRSDPKAAAAIRFLPGVDDARLQWLYRNCRFTVFPSFSEGFGLPIVESLAFGKPCIASSTTSLPEASQGAAIHIDPTDARAWQQMIERLLDDDEALARAARDIAARFKIVSWSDTAQDVLAAIAAELQPVNDAAKVSREPVRH